MRKEWKDDHLFDDLVIDHLYPGATYCPPHGFGILSAPPEVWEKSNEAAERITGKTIQQLTQEMIDAMLK